MGIIAQQVRPDTYEGNVSTRQAGKGGSQDVRVGHPNSGADNKKKPLVLEVISFLGRAENYAHVSLHKEHTTCRAAQKPGAKPHLVGCTHSSDIMYETTTPAMNDSMLRLKK